MSTTLAPQPIALAPRLAPVAAAKPAKTWLVGPWFDLLFLANLAWPLAVLLALLRPLDESNPLSLFQVYFLSTPHRWITLVLVFCDSERFWKEPAKFGGIAIGLILLGLGLVVVAGLVPYAANSLMLLMMLDYIWNAWHFAAQHAGIARIYGRITRPEQSLAHAEFEKMALRTLVLWVFFRFAVRMAVLSEYGANVRWLTPWLPWVDPLALLFPAILMMREVRAYRKRRETRDESRDPKNNPGAFGSRLSSLDSGLSGRLAYIASVIAIYTAQLVAIRLQETAWMVGFFFAGAIFHAVEYLAVCNWSVQKRTTGIWHYQVTRTGLAVVVFMAILGAANYFVNAQSVYAWQLITLLVSLLHYAYDGIIWRAKPAPKTV